MDENNIKNNNEVNEDYSNERLGEEKLLSGLKEIKTQKLQERILLGVIVGGIVLSMFLGYNIWQRNSASSETIDYYSGGNQSGYTLPTATQPAYAGAGGCCGAGGASGAASVQYSGTAGYSAGGGCCGGGSTSAAALDAKQIEDGARQFYRQNFGDDTGLDFKVQNFGCHIQIDVYKAGKIIKTLIYRGGQFTVY